MPLSQTEQILSANAISAAQAHLETTSPPMMLDARVAEALRRNGADHGLAVIKAHVASFNELSAQSNILFTQVYGLERRIEALRSEQGRDIGQPERAQLYEPGTGRAIPPLSLEERERGRRLVEEYPSRLAAQIVDATEQLEALRARRAAVSTRLGPLGGRLRQCYAHIRRAGGNALRSATPPNPGKLTLDAGRARVEQVRAEARKLAAAPRTAGEVKQLITEWAARKTQGPGIKPMFDPKGEVEPFLPGQEVAGAWAPDPLALALWVGGDEIIKRMHAAADRVAAPDAIDAGTRAKRLAECREHHLTALRVEEAVAGAALQAGEPVVLRAIPDDNDALPWADTVRDLNEAIADHVRAILSLA
jgi:hypothetical protein